MICFDEGARRFNYRVAGVAIHNDAVLLHRADRDSFWTLPGGRAEHGESAGQTLRREIREELETEIEIVRLLWFVENFFAHEGRRYHEIALYFLMRFPENSLSRTSAAFDRIHSGTLFRFAWHPVEAGALTQLPVFPAFLRQALTSLPTSIVHIVERESDPPAMPD